MRASSALPGRDPASVLDGSPWTPLSCDCGFEPGTNTVTLFPGEAPRSIVDQLARDPEHARVFREAGWDEQKLLARLHELLMLPGSGIIRGAGGAGRRTSRRLDLDLVFQPGRVQLVLDGETHQDGIGVAESFSPGCLRNQRIDHLGPFGQEDQRVEVEFVDLIAMIGHEL